MVRANTSIEATFLVPQFAWKIQRNEIFHQMTTPYTSTWNNNTSQHATKNGSGFMLELSVKHDMDSNLKNEARHWIFCFSSWHWALSNISRALEENPLIQHRIPAWRSSHGTASSLLTYISCLAVLIFDFFLRYHVYHCILNILSILVYVPAWRNNHD